MKNEKSIIFSGLMVKAILDGRKTQTRRIIKPQPTIENDWFNWEGRRPKAKYFTGACASTPPDPNMIAYNCPYGQVGDLLWVRESIYQYGRDTYSIMTGYHWMPKKGEPILYVADKPERKFANSIGDWYHRTFPSIHMKKKYARIWLEITNIRVEKIQDISANDIISEGLDIYPIPLNFEKFKQLWDSLNAKRGYSWDKNPWVWVIEFKKIKPD